MFNAVLTAMGILMRYTGHESTNKSDSELKPDYTLYLKTVRKKEKKKKLFVKSSDSATKSMAIFI